MSISWITSCAAPGQELDDLLPQVMQYQVDGLIVTSATLSHHFEQQGDADQMLSNREWTEPNDQDEAMLRQFAERYFPGGAGPTMALAMCMFTNAPDGHFIIDQHPDQPTVWFISACSGHGFTFASVMGEIMVDLAVQGTTRHDVSLFRLARLWEGVNTPA